MSVVSKAVEWAVDIANDDSHGYSQTNRWGNPDYDCSSFVISAYEQAGVPVKTKGATYTGNMYSVFTACGFVDVISKINLSTGNGLVAGDVLLNRASHTCIYIGDGKVVNCRTDTDGVSGDSHGDEIRIQSYWNFPWDAVLRYPESTSTASKSTSKSASIASPTVAKSATTSSDLIIPADTQSIGVAAIQGMLKYLGYNLGRCGVDGDSGPAGSYTNIAVKEAISAGKLTSTTVKSLLSITK